MSEIALGTPTPDTVLARVPLEWQDALTAALDRPLAERREAISAVAVRYPKHLDAWARLSALARDDAEAYAYARLGYHRGLDALRASGWKGSGFVRWRYEENRGFLRAVDALRSTAQAIGETDEEVRCELFLHQLDPDWEQH